MNADQRSRRALELFDALVDLEPAARDAELARLTEEDAALGAELQGLLRADATDGVLERTLPSLGTFVGAAPAVEPLPARIGPWAITGTAGRGGMGAVYLGERDDGQFHQRAAIKLIRLGMDTPQLRVRFLRERQILARLRHPHIATLLDGGVTDTGAPYFAMERVEGQPIDAWCDAHRSSLRDRVSLFLEVCAAVQHAHQNLIIHRDLKPANILIDADGRAKLLDFGIAKLLDADAQTGATTERPHTPDYAAPEQLAGGAITTATDVYGLGVVLHRLLSGVAPDEGGASLTRAAARASDDEARARGLASKKLLASALRGDLSAIVGHCLQGEPSLRYPSVNELTSDLRAWLGGRPVQAQRPTRAYVLRKFVRRNRWGVLAAALVLVAVIGGVAGVLWQSAQARKSAADAQAQLHYLSSLLDVLAPGTEETRELNRSHLVAEAARRARAELASRPESLASVELALAQVAQNVADYPQAMALADSAYAQRLKTFGADALVTTEALMLAAAVRTQLSPPKFDEAAQMLDAAIANARVRAPGSALLASALQKRSTLLGDQDRLEDQRNTVAEAAALCEGPLASNAVCEDVWLELGSIASRNRQPQEALVQLRRAWEGRKKRLGPDHASTLQVASTLAWAQGDANDLQAGLALAEQVYAANQRIYTQPTEVSLMAMLRYARLLKRAGEFERAEKMVEEYLGHARRLFGEENQNTVLGLSDRASVVYTLGRFDEAAVQFDLVTKRFRALKSEINAAIAQNYAGDARREAGRPGEALEMQREAIAAMRRLYPKGENLMLGRALSALALTETALGRFDDALAHADEGVAMTHKLQSGSASAAYATAQRALTVWAMGRSAEAEQQLRAAREAFGAQREQSHNMYWDTVAMLTGAACANRAVDCESLRAELKTADEKALAFTTLQRVRAERAK